MADSEVQIIVTAVDNASKEINQVTQSITGISKAADSTPQSTAKLSSAMQLLSRVSPEASRALGSVTSSARLLGVTSLAGAGGVAALGAAVFAAVAAAKKAGDTWAAEVTTKWIENTTEDVRIATEYEANMTRVGKNIANMSINIGKIWAEYINFQSQKPSYYKGEIPVELKPQITQEAFDKLVAQGVKAAEAAAEAAVKTTQKYQNDWFKSLFSNAMSFDTLMEKADDLKKVYEDVKKAGPVKEDWLGYLSATEAAKKNWQDSVTAIEEAKNKMIAMKLIESFGSENSVGGITYTPEEEAAITQFLTETGLASNEAIQAAWAVNNETATIINEVIAVTNANIDSVDANIQAIKDKVAKVTIEATATGDLTYFKWIVDNFPTTGGGGGQTGGFTSHGNSKAGGGDFSGWAMVGDSAGGGITPYTEWVYAPYGARVYNQSQIGAAPMAGGGFINPANSIDYDKLAIIVRDAVLLGPQ
jgi:hypothetical protein